MPYASARQRAYMHIHHPEIAKRWDKEMSEERHGPIKTESVARETAVMYRKHGHRSHIIKRREHGETMYYVVVNRKES